MTANFHEMLAYAFEEEAGLTRTKARSLASFFADLKEFIDLPVAQMRRIRSISGKSILTISDDELERVESLQTSGCLFPDLTVAENYLSLISRQFTRKQVKMLENLSLDILNPNPFLIRSLNLDTPEEVVRLNVYMAATRSIVTSMGFFIENLQATSSENVSVALRYSFATFTPLIGSSFLIFQWHKTFRFCYPFPGDRIWVFTLTPRGKIVFFLSATKRRTLDS